MLTGNFSAWRVDDEINVTILDAIEHVWPSFVNLENFCHFDFRFRQRFGGSGCRNNFKSEFHKFSRDRDHRFLIGVFDADEYFSFFW